MCVNQNKALCNNYMLLILQLDSYEVTMRFGIFSYATETKEIVSITNDLSQDVQYVLRKLQEFSDESMFIYYNSIVVFLLQKMLLIVRFLFVLFPAKMSRKYFLI